MKRFFFAAILAALTLSFAPSAEARTSVSFGVGVGCCGGGYYPGYYPAYPAYYGYPYYAPPVVYAAPPPVVYAQPPSLFANQTSPTFIDAAGRTCRHYQTVATGGPPVAGTACLEPDGVWRAMGG